MLLTKNDLQREGSSAILRDRQEKCGPAKERAAGPQERAQQQRVFPDGRQDDESNQQERERQRERQRSCWPNAHETRGRLRGLLGLRGPLCRESVNKS